MVTRANPVNSKKDTCQLYRYYLVFFIQLCECYSRCDWSLPITYLEYRYKDDVNGNLFSLSCSTWRVVLKMLVRLFRIKPVKALKKV